MIVHLLPLAIATMALAQILDLGTFVAMVRQLGIGSEANPVIASMVDGYGLPFAAIAKVALIAFVIAVTVVLTARSTRLEQALGIVVLAVAIVAGVVGGGSNVLTMGPLPLAR